MTNSLSYGFKNRFKIFKKMSRFSIMAIFAQSICTPYSKLSGRPDILLGSGTLKKSGPKKSRVPKNRVIVIQKENRKPGLFSFGITMTLIFCTLLFFGPDFFSGSQTDPCFQKQE
jgi:hypothetical protein